MDNEYGLLGGGAAVRREPGGFSSITGLIVDTTTFDGDFNTSEFTGDLGVFTGTRTFTDVDEDTGATIPRLGSEDKGTPRTVISASERRILLGRVVITGSATPGTTTFTLLEDNNVGRSAQTFVTWRDRDPDPVDELGYNLDPLVQANTFTVTVTPEPTVLGLGGLALGGLLLRRRRNV